MFGSFQWQEFVSAFVVLFAVIDITGSIPVILTLKKRGKKINAAKAALLALIMFSYFSLWERLFSTCLTSTSLLLRLPALSLSLLLLWK